MSDAFGVGSTVGGLFSVGLASQANKNAKKAARRAYERSVRSYKNRYQWQMEDMKKAGLNPILSYMQQPPGGPQGVQAQVFSAHDAAGRAGAGAGEAINRAFSNKTERTAKEQQADLWDAQRRAQITASNANASVAMLNDSKTRHQNLLNELQGFTNQAHRDNKTLRAASITREATGSSAAGAGSMIWNSPSIKKWREENLPDWVNFK